MSLQAAPSHSVSATLSADGATASQPGPVPLSVGSLRIAMTVGSLAGGGAERMTKVLAEAWTARGHQVRVITLAGREVDFHQLDEGVERVALGVVGDSRGALDALTANAGRVRALRRALREARADVVVSMGDQTNVLTLAAATALGVPVIAAERTNPLRHPLGRVWKTARKLIYRRAAAVVILTQPLRAWAEALTAPGRVVVIPNPAATPQHDPDAARPVKPAGRRLLLAVGRLGPEKGFDLILTAFERLASEFPDWDLVILGEGPERARLEAQARTLGLLAPTAPLTSDGTSASAASARVRMPGAVRGPGAWLAAADLFVAASRYEGFPNAIVEALASGVPVVAADCETGPSDIIRPEIDGLLVPPEDATALHAALWRVMGDEGLRRRMAGRAPEVMERFGFERVLGMWDELFAKVLARRRRAELASPDAGKGSSSV